jgi:hypothetical protein
MLSTMLLFKGLLFSQYVITSVFAKSIVLIHIVMTILELMAMYQRAYGLALNL